MTDSTNATRQALIAGDGLDDLDPDEMNELVLLSDLLADPATWAVPPAGLEDEIARTLAAIDPLTATPTPHTATRSRRATKSRSRRILLSAGAAVAAIVVVVGALVTLGGSASTDFSGQLAATRLAPDAHASVGITRNGAGFRVSLDATGLPPLQGGQFYQAWLKNPAGTLVPIGSFSSSDGRVTLWSGVSPKEYPVLTVTIEVPDGNQASSGRRVLVGGVKQG
jgi:hypothetical protein